jgi:regulator of replication initiation timing
VTSSLVAVGSITASTGTLTIAGISSSATVSVTGTVSATTFSNPSDRRLKENINLLDQRSRQLFSLNGVSFNYKRNNEGGGKLGAISKDGDVDVDDTHFGFIAQDVEVSYPELVGRTDNGLLSVHYTEFIPLIVEGMKEQRRQLDTMQSSIKSIQGSGLNTKRSVVNVKGLAAMASISSQFAHVHEDEIISDSNNNIDVEDIFVELRRDLDTVLSDNQELKVDNQELKADNQKLRRDLDTVMSDNKELKVDNKELRRDLDTVMGDNKELKEVIELLRGQVEGVLSYMGRSDRQQ